MEYKFNTVVVVYDYAYLNGGAANVAINSAIVLAEKCIYDVIYFKAVGPVCDELYCTSLKFTVKINAAKYITLEK